MKKGLVHCNDALVLTITQKKSMNILVHRLYYFVFQGVSRSAFCFAALRQQDYFFMNQTRGRPLSQGVPSSKTVHWTVLEFTLCRGIAAMRFRTLRSATRGFAPWTPPPLKRRAKLFNMTVFLKRFTLVLIVNFGLMFVRPLLILCSD